LFLRELIFDIPQFRGAHLFRIGRLTPVGRPARGGEEAFDLPQQQQFSEDYTTAMMAFAERNTGNTAGRRPTTWRIGECISGATAPHVRQVAVAVASVRKQFAAPIGRTSRLIKGGLQCPNWARFLFFHLRKGFSLFIWLSCVQRGLGFGFPILERFVWSVAGGCC
jgi:hypothetical protein